MTIFPGYLCSVSEQTYQSRIDTSDAIPATGKSEPEEQTMTRLLVVDDDIDLLELMTTFFGRYDIEIETASSGQELDRKLAESTFDIIILDIMLPGEDGISICRRMREKSSIPIIMLTAVSETTERVVGLELGADDYVTKPFEPRELLARVRAVLRRVTERTDSQACSSSSLQFRHWRLNVARRELRRPDQTLIPLSGGEFALLMTFLSRPGQLLSRDQLLDYTKGSAHEVFDRSIDVLVSRLRRKLETDPRRPEIIKTVRNMGYLFSPAVHRS